MKPNRKHSNEARAHFLSKLKKVSVTERQLNYPGGKYSYRSLLTMPEQTGVDFNDATAEVK